MGSCSSRDHVTYCISALTFHNFCFQLLLLPQYSVLSHDLYIKKYVNLSLFGQYVFFSYISPPLQKMMQPMKSAAPVPVGLRPLPETFPIKVIANTPFLLVMARWSLMRHQTTWANRFDKGFITLSFMCPHFKY